MPAFGQGRGWRTPAGKYRDLALGIRAWSESAISAASGRKRDCLRRRCESGFCASVTAQSADVHRQRRTSQSRARLRRPPRMGRTGQFTHHADERGIRGAVVAQVMGRHVHEREQGVIGMPVHRVSQTCLQAPGTCWRSQPDADLAAMRRSATRCWPKHQSDRRRDGRGWMQAHGLELQRRRPVPARSFQDDHCGAPSCRLPRPRLA